MKALVFGTNGQVARELALRADCVSVEAVGRDVADFTDPDACAAIAAATVAELLTRDEALRAQESPPEDVTLRPRLSRSG